MGILRTEGFDALLAAVTDEAAVAKSAYQAVHHVATLGGRLAPEIGLRALTDREAYLVEAMLAAAATIAPPTTMDDAVGDRLAVTRTGKVRILSDGEAPAADTALFGVVEWHGGRCAEIVAEAERLRAADAMLVRSCADWLVTQGQARADDLVAHLRHVLSHVGPMRVYVGDACFTNLGKGANLVGKSVAVDSDRCRLKVLADTPVADWADADAGFVVCQSVLLASGTPSRNEEFSGTQLVPDRLEAFLRDRVAAYDGTVPASIEALGGPDRLFTLAALAGRLRQDKVDRGSTFYRTVQSMTINKREHLFAVPVTGADLPELFVRTVMETLPGATAADVRGGRIGWTSVFGDLQGGAGFSTGFEEVLHTLVAAAAESTGTDVAMSRGPRDVLRLSELIAAGDAEPGHWKTSEYYCCVVPSADFRSRFAAAPAELPQVVRAVAARMRWNGWHFMPHAAGVCDRPEFADRDWFFAPTMPDITEWTSHHHQGHVANGVRHAIRVPLPLTLAGRSRPGVHDLRLMRTDDPTYELADLRAAVAMGDVLRGLYQAHADRIEATGVPLTVTDFENPWYQARYSPVERVMTTRMAVGSDAR